MGGDGFEICPNPATLGGDVDRAERQQQVVLAVREKVLSLNMILSCWPSRRPSGKRCKIMYARI
ncbi:MAG: hypothetical protein M5U34_03155 [Chloroflexi bacterium]|nr:hypothetical protein [Chloroflexota bacterium]